MSIHLSLPLPPSKNRARRSVNGRVLLSREARAYRDLVAGLVWASTTVEDRESLAGHRLSLVVEVRFPDRRRRDLGNVLDELCDAVAPALGIDDSQFWRIDLTRWEFGDAGCVVRIGREELTAS